jgi:hypothetical protein
MGVALGGVQSVFSLAHAGIAGSMTVETSRAKKSSAYRSRIIIF